LNDLDAKNTLEIVNVPKRIALGWIRRRKFPNGRNVTIMSFSEICLFPDIDLVGFKVPKTGSKTKYTKSKGELTI
jgi:hypothetical protein